jgi:steroid 5-alpha reductase family enzyme
VTLGSILLANAVLVGGCVFALWLLSVAIRDTSVVDLFWGVGFVLIAWLTFMLADGDTARKWLVTILVTTWGLRLSGYLAWRNLGKGEDYRYRAMREKRGQSFVWQSLYIVFGLQGAIMWTVSIPVQAAQIATVSLGAWEVVGTIVWTIGWLCESLADVQMARFKANPENKGKVLDRGLWRYTRHPNYFGDFLVWWGFYFIAVGAGAAWTIFSPILMSILLRNVSGVTLLESSLKETKPGYAEYVQKTNAFFPWFPRT